MKQLINNKWAWAVAILVILNVLSLSTVWFTTCNRHQSHHFNNKDGGRFKHRGGHHKGRGHDFLTKELQLSDEQEKTFGKLREEHFVYMDSAFSNIQKLRVELTQHLGEPETSVNDIFLKIAAQEADIQKNTFEHFSKMYSICNEDQKKILKEKLIQITSKRGGAFKMHGQHQRGMRHNMPPPSEENSEEELPHHQ